MQVQSLIDGAMTDTMFFCPCAVQLRKLAEGDALESGQTGRALIFKTCGCGQGALLPQRLGASAKAYALVLASRAKIFTP